MFAHHRKRLQLLFALADAILTILAFEAAYLTRTHLTLERRFFLPLHIYVLLICFCAAVWVGLGALQRLYEYLDSASMRRIFTNTLRQSAAGIVAVILFQYLLRVDPPLSRSFLALLFVYTFAALAIFRWRAPGLIGAFQRGFGSPYHLVIVASRTKASQLAEQLRSGSPFRIEIVAAINEEECAAELPKLLSRSIVDEVIFDVSGSQLMALEEVFLRCDEEGVRTRVALDFFPHINSEMTLDRVGDEIGRASCRERV